MDIILDIKILIATALSELPYSDDITVWVRLMMIDNEFNEWAQTDIGINRFIQSFTKTVSCGHSVKNFMVINMLKSYSCMTLLFGMNHSINDQPSLVHNDIKIWNKYMITENGYKESVRHRDGDKPAFISPTIEAWYINGVYHREGDKPACINTKWVDGELVKTYSWWEENTFIKYMDSRDGKFIYDSDEIPLDDLACHI